MMGGALIRKCWDVQEETWGGQDRFDYESTDNSHQYGYHHYYHEHIFPNNSNIDFIQRQSI
jgi:hypothetical protein